MTRRDDTTEHSRRRFLGLAAWATAGMTAAGQRAQLRAIRVADEDA